MSRLLGTNTPNPYSSERVISSQDYAQRVFGSPGLSAFETLRENALSVLESHPKIFKGIKTIRRSTTLSVLSILLSITPANSDTTKYGSEPTLEDNTFMLDFACRMKETLGEGKCILDYSSQIDEIYNLIFQMTSYVGNTEVRGILQYMFRAKELDNSAIWKQQQDALFKELPQEIHSITGIILIHSGIYFGGLET